MRRALFTLLLTLAAVPTAAVAQLPPLPPPPPLPTVPLPLPVPTPVPAPTAPLPALPAAPAPAPLPAAPQAPAVSAPAPGASQTPTVSAATGSPSTPASGSRPTTGNPSTSSGVSTAPGRSGRATATAPRRRPSVVLPFRVPSSGRVALRLRQVAPVCRSAGRLLVTARKGANRFRFNGRVSGRPLRDGTYVATTPSGTVRFAIVDGKPTRSARLLAWGVCDSGVPVATTAVAGISLGRTAAAPTANTDRGTTDEPGPVPRVLGTAFTKAAEAAASLHPAFYVLLGLAIVALAFATVPARVVPVAGAGAVLARHRAAVTLAGTLSLLLVIVVYWVTLL